VDEVRGTQTNLLVEAELIQLPEVITDHGETPFFQDQSAGHDTLATQMNDGDRAPGAAAAVPGDALNPQVPRLILHIGSACWSFMTPASVTLVIQR